MSSGTKELLSWVKAIVIAVVIAFLIRQFLFTPSLVKGESMMPNLQDGNRLIVSKISKIERYDEIIFHAPDANEEYVKRVIGLPGDTVEMKNDQLYINGKAVPEPYLKQKKSEQPEGTLLTEDFTLNSLFGVEKVPKDTLFVLGDNRPASKDGRIFGFIKKDSVVGEVKLRIWPLNKIGFPK
ncbi:signal peptidase I [Priestia koreensis]|uniref:signal peptidase I n=1 Tax=Priestia koreensis TaxID=284581 RepID=UPI0028F7230E|nr:signal peptidase I [Priestia koreensis]